MKYNSKISKNEVMRLASLSRINIDDSEVDLYINQLNKIVKYVSKLDELDLSSIEPLFHVLDETIIGRNDEVEPSLRTEELLSNAVNTVNNFYKVSQVIKGKKISK